MGRVCGRCLFIFVDIAKNVARSIKLCIHDMKLAFSPHPKQIRQFGEIHWIDRNDTKKWLHGVVQKHNSTK